MKSGSRRDYHHLGPLKTLTPRCLSIRWRSTGVKISAKRPVPPCLHTGIFGVDYTIRWKRARNGSPLIMSRNGSSVSRRWSINTARWIGIAPQLGPQKTRSDYGWALTKKDEEFFIINRLRLLQSRRSEC